MLLWLSGLLLTGCSPPAPPAEPSLEQLTVSPTRAERFEVSWQGVLPCADCAGIETRLVLRRDGGQRSYELEEVYLGGDDDNRFHESGPWRETSLQLDGRASTVYELGEAGQRRFRLLPDGALQWLDSEGRTPANELDYRLQRL